MLRALTTYHSDNLPKKTCGTTTVYRFALYMFS